MATYLELFSLRADSDLQDRTAVAIVKKAQTLLDGATPSIAEVAWAVDALANPTAKVPQLLHYVLASNSGASVAAIQAANDATLQSAVGSAVDVIVSGGS